MRTGVVSLLDEKTALIAATDDSYKDTTKYCDFYHMDLADGSMKLIHPYESSIGGSSVGSDLKLWTENFTIFPPWKIFPISIRSRGAALSPSR